MPASPAQTVREKPVAVVGTAFSLVSFILTALVAHKVIGTVDVSATTATVAPFVAMVIPALAAAIIHALVSPYEKVKRALETAGLMSDADFGRIEALISDKLGVDIPAGGPTTGPVPVSAGMDAGAPQPAQ